MGYLAVGLTEVVFEIDSRLIEKLRRRNKRMLVLPIFLVAALLLVPPLTNLVLLPYLKRPPEPLNLWNYTGILLLVGLIAGVAFLHYYNDMLEVNRFAVTETGLYPPFKRKGRRMKKDWFVPYGEIVAIEPVEPRKNFVPGFNIMLKDGYVFQLLTLDAINYVSEKECHRYEKLIRTVYEQVTNPENRAQVGDGFRISRETFERGPQQPVPRDPDPPVNLFSKEAARRMLKPRHILELLAIPAVYIAYVIGIPTWLISLVVTVGGCLVMLNMELNPLVPKMRNPTTRCTPKNRQLTHS